MPIENKYDEKQIKNRFLELAKRSYEQNTYTFTGFLGLTEQSLFWEVEREVASIGYALDGGNPVCDRKVMRFGKEEELGYEEDFPIVCIKITPLIKKFSDEFSHRDFLGAIMNLGIDRSTIGDIFLQENEGYVYCLESISDYIMENLDKVKHTHIKCEKLKDSLRFIKDEGKILEITVTSDRIDVVVSGVYHVSRSESLSYFEKGIVYVNGRLCTSNAKNLKAGDVVNVRGKGKFLYQGTQHITKKEKCRISVQVYK